MIIFHDGIHSCIYLHLGQKKIIDAIPHADNAGYKSMSNSDKAFYVSGTREAVWKRLEEWVSSDKPICFLIGAAGMGKSTIASEFCRRYKTQLGASFFFRRNDANVGSTRMFFTTLAYQLAHSSWKELRPYIARAAELHIRGGRSQQMLYAVEDLLRTPLGDAQYMGSTRSPMFLVVDALDECSESSSQPDLIPDCLKLLISCVLEHHSSVRLLLTSRPVPDHVGNVLRRAPELEASSVLLALYNIEEREAIDCDIRNIIQERLCTVEEGAQWHQSNPDVADRLTRQSQGVFVYARTAVDFILRGEGIAQKDRRLRLLLTPGNTYGLNNLDLLYRTVLETAFPSDELDPETREQVRLILGWVALYQDSDGISLEDVENISGIPCVESIPIFSRLRSVLAFESSLFRQSYRAMHVTFRDFLTDQARCGDFYVDPGLMHARLATGMVTMLHIKQNWVGKYAPAYWLWHAKQASPTEELSGVFKTAITSLFSGRPSVFVERLYYIQSLYVIMDRDVVDRKIIAPIIHSKLCATEDGARCYQRDPTIVTQLVAKSEGMWHYVCTALRFICGGANTPDMEYRLQLVLAPRETYGLSNLDLLYRTVLEYAFPPGDMDSLTRERVQRLLGWSTIWMHAQPDSDPHTTFSALVALSGISSHDLTSILIKLYPVLLLPSRTAYADYQILRGLHITFAEFVRNREHSGVEFYVDSNRMHARFAVDCVRFLHNHLSTKSSWSYAERYATNWWSKHVVGSRSSTGDLTDVLQEVFSSVSTNQPSFFFSYRPQKFYPYHELVPWVDKHIVSYPNYHSLGIKANLLMLVVTGPGTS